MTQNSPLLTLAEAVTMLAFRGRSLTRQALRQALHKQRERYGRFPGIERRLDEAGKRVALLIRDLNIEAWGVPYVREPGLLAGPPKATGEDARLDQDRAFLMGSIWADPLADAVWTEPWLEDGAMNPVDRGYKNVRLCRAQFLAAIEGRGEGAAQAPEPARQVEIAELKAKMIEWYCRERILQCQGDGIIPPRADCERAAREKFGEGGQVRDLLRGIRREHAPAEWLKRGPKGLDRKRA